jgi:hypothetical protein
MKNQLLAVKTHLVSLITRPVSTSPSTIFSDSPGLPRLIKDGFNRDDITRKYERDQQERPHPLGDKFLHGDSVPTVGQVAKVQVNLARPMKGNFGGQTTWFLMTGLVVEVLDCWRVRAELTPSSDNAPRSFYANWDVVLTYDGAYTCPWILVSMRPVPEDKGNASAP